MKDNTLLAGVIGQNAVENNYLSKKQVNELNTKLNALNNGTKACRDKACVEEINKERNKLIEEYRAISKKQDV
ncbi:VENN motif pre-toxin domain-containing protein [Acinetobacter sp. YH12126]|uniref:VENN motif pre-toxin domain-containing protein n=1 Tax=Acinetobacter sp. YH12126 TaxID=2601111 RepID=UPI0015D222B3|nr:VENN motif pre-toxin domain-containing protein [Acinetobacter sp. YH12126]